LSALRRALRGSVVLFVLIGAPWVAASDAVYDIDFSAGLKSLDKDDWEPVDAQPELGVAATLAGDGWPVGIAVDLLLSQDESERGGVTYDGRTAELALGVRKIWTRGRFRPRLGAGVGLVRAEVEAAGPGSTGSDDDAALGYWIEGGVGWRLGRRVNLGLTLRWSVAEVTLAGVDGEAGGVHLGLLLGFGSPR